MRTNPLRALMLSLALLFGFPAVSSAAIAVSITVAPPAIPVYEQPPCPAVGYMWTPGYWAWDPTVASYYWVPGVWVAAPAVGMLWTPGYWGFADNIYVWHAGYWGPHIGFYGGVDYGYGYGGTGFDGGYWRNNRFFYNREVLSVGHLPAAQIYSHPVPGGARPPEARPSFNGGPGGIEARPTPAELAVERAPHRAPTAEQLRNVQAARALPELRANQNEGHPPIAAAPRAGAFKGPGIVAANGARPVTPQAAPNERREAAPNERREPGAQPQAAQRPPQPEPNRPSAPRGEEAARRQPQPQAARRPPQPQPEAARPQPQPEAARPNTPPREEAARPQPQHAQPQVARAPQVARPEQPRAQPQVAPRAEPPRPQPQAEAPRPPQPQPQAMQRPPQPQPQAPRQGAQPREGNRDRDGHG